MLFIFVLIQALSASETTAKYLKAVSLFESAQQEYISGNYEKMYELLLESLRTYPHDPLFNKQVATFAKYYYSMEPSLLKQPIQDLALSLTVERTQSRGRPMQFALTLACRSNLTNQPAHVVVVLPSGEEKVVLGSDTETEYYPSNAFPGKYVVASTSGPFSGPLPIGIYNWKFTLKDGRKVEYPIIAIPDNRDDQLPKLTLDPLGKNIKWTISPSLSVAATDDPNYVPYRSAIVSVHEGNSFRPTTNQVIKIKNLETAEGQMPLVKGIENGRYILTTWEAYARDGDLGLTFETVYELTTKK